MINFLAKTRIFAGEDFSLKNVVKIFEHFWKSKIIKIYDKIWKILRKSGYKKSLFREDDEILSKR